LRRISVSDPHGREGENEREREEMEKSRERGPGR
jgi:hypothetical protein